MSNNETALTLRCTSTNSAATNVIWTKNGIPLPIDGQKYKVSQTVISRIYSTYENELKIHDLPDNLLGNYTCNVSNAFGSSHRSIGVEGEFTEHSAMFYYVILCTQEL